MSAHPQEPDVGYMIGWIARDFRMSTAELARMFETSPAVIAAWRSGGPIKDLHLQKLRRSFYFLNNAQDPKAGQKKCAACSRWKRFEDYTKDAPVCLACGGRI